ncbi:uncharacterized protein BDZ99DRAFT_402885 [Mytilinidion resinicola]|uniref:Tail specific protease domain-containing protein n=1 Tax=Mytilinidion resinicola TaxID=574789 RepID=A0A6A6XYU7_9PEZI|nr:uncharacterized protein BDZ99DRAFT_402885 [Mytilinidion resinicola]KAF2801731.1 hypothetical protein BDZ99DRAFT_402885 [Mytilinidion resinicola]
MSFFYRLTALLCFASFALCKSIPRPLARDPNNIGGHILNGLAWKQASPSASLQSLSSEISSNTAIFSVSSSDGAVSISSSAVSSSSSAVFTSSSAISSSLIEESPTATVTAANPADTICGDIIDAVNDGSVLFWASDAHACLSSVPFNPAVAARFIDYFNTTLQFHSTIAYLKDPPTGYQQPAVDVLEGLRLIQQNITAGTYKSQYAFEADLQLLVYAFHDAHVDLTAGVLSAFSFASPVEIASVSKDGKEAPKLYITQDLIDSPGQGWEPFPITEINGEEAVDYLTRFAALNSIGTLEPHADWNLLMSNPALDIQGFLNTFSGGATFYPGENLTFSFANDTTLETIWLAIYNNPSPTGPLTTGGDFYNYFVLGLLPASFEPATASSIPSAVPTATPTNTPTPTSWFNESYGAYPDDPDIIQLDLSIGGGGVVSGYYLHNISTGVLSIPTFDQFGWNIGNFSTAVRAFIDGATAANLSRVVIDLQQNTGGNVELAFDTFSQFFPKNDPFAGSRRRSHELANIIGGATTGYWDSLSDDDDEFEKDSLAANEWVVTDRLNAETKQVFTSWAEYFGPLSIQDDEFSLTERYNLSDQRYSEAAFDGWIPYGYGPDNQISTPQPWKPEDIAILTDGICSSTCSLLLEMMTQAGVRTVVAGGRPSAGPMQAASGNRGARAYSADAIDGDIEFASSINQTANSSLPQVRESGMYTIFAGINLRDQVRANDTTPLQFKYEAADCRIYYTLANIYNIERLWRDAAAATWDDKSLCVEGSTGYAASANKGTPKPPPPATAQAPTLNVAEHAEFNLEPTGGLPDGKGIPKRNSQIQSCNSQLTCDDGISSCKEILVTCSNGKRIFANACLPPCQNRDGSDSCQGANTFCNIQSTQESKAASGFSSAKAAGARTQFTKFDSSLRTGLCMPTVGNPNLGCPKPKA